jgi:hypothetical protein
MHRGDTDNHWTAGPTTDTVSGHMNDTYNYNEENSSNFNADFDPADFGLVGDGTVSYVEKSNTTYGGTISSDAANPGSITAVTNASGHVTFQAGDNETQDYTIQQSSLQIGNGSPTVTGSETFTSVDGGDTNGPITTTTLSGFSQDILGFPPPEFNAGYSNHINQVIGGDGLCVSDRHSAHVAFGADAAGQCDTRCGQPVARQVQRRNLQLDRQCVLETERLHRHPSNPHRGHCRRAHAASGAGVRCGEAGRRHDA